jgi:uncharacterized protein
MPTIKKIRVNENKEGSFSSEEKRCVMNESKFQAAADCAIDLLRQKLFPALTYHDVRHTLDVVQACEQLAEAEGVDEESRRLLLMAAYFHDTGLTAIASTDQEAFNAAREVHEARAAEIAREVLPRFGFQAEELDIIDRLILATTWGHTPQDLLEQIVSDADISSIGGETDYFLSTSDGLRAELAAFGFENTDKGWLENQKEFVGAYDFHTASAHRLFDENRLRNVAAIQTRLNALDS